jgi:hypothetical protein
MEELGIPLSASLNNRWNVEKNRALEFRHALSLITLSSHKGGYEYIFIKNCNSIPNIPRDIDIYIKSKDQEKIMALLATKGMKNVQKSVTETAMKGDLMRVDFYTSICYVGITFFDDALLWNSRVLATDQDLQYIDLTNETNFLVMLVHSIFGHRSMSLLDFLHMGNIRPFINIGECREKASQKGWGLMVDLALATFDGLYETIYSKRTVVLFPFLFDSDFVIHCINKIDDLTVEYSQKLALHVTLFQDKLIFLMKDTRLYLLLKNFEPVRNMINTTTAYIKSGRRDKKNVL